MSDTFDMLSAVKSALGIVGQYQDDTVQKYIDDVQFFLTDAGVPEDITKSAAAAGVISRGVADLWAYGSGTGKLSPYFYARAIQLAAGKTDTEESNG